MLPIPSTLAKFTAIVFTSLVDGVPPLDPMVPAIIGPRLNSAPCASPDAAKILGYPEDVGEEDHPERLKTPRSKPE